MLPPNELTTYEKEQVESIKRWKNKEPSIVSKTFGFLAQPVTWLAQKVIPNAAIRGVLNAANGAAYILADTEDIERDAGVQKISDLKVKNLEVSDTLSNEVHNWAIAIGTVEGGVTGAAGLPGLALDVPAIITIALRTIYKIALCYGYECKDEQDKNYVLGILSASGANTMAEKAKALLTLKTIEVSIAKTTWKAMAKKAANSQFSKSGGIISIKHLAKQLGINLTKRKAAQIIPVVGSGVGASVNGLYIQGVGWAARRKFQERWLIDNQKLIDI